MSPLPSSPSMKQRLSNTWDMLVKPHSSIEGIETRKNARLLSGMLLSVPLILAVIITILGLIDSNDLLIPAAIGGYFMIALCISLYFLNKAGYFAWSKHVFIGSIFLLAIVLPYIEGSTTSIAPFGVIPVILVGIFYAGVWIYLTTVIVLVTTFILNQLNYGSGYFWDLQSAWYFLVFSSSLVIVFVRHLQELERIRHQELEFANQRLRESEEMLEYRVEERTAALPIAYDEVEALNHVKDEFVSNVSHELRTPISSIKLQHYLLKQNASPKQNGNLETLQRETDRLNMLIESLLTLSRLDQKNIELKYERINLNHIVGEYVTDRKDLAEDKQLSLEFTPHSEDVWVSGDWNLIGQVLSILLTNAFNYTPPGGQIIVSTSEFINPQKEKWARFSVRDTGMGIPPGDQAQLFSRFFRGQSARETKVSGTGLGLSIAKSIIDQYHGLIEVESTGKTDQGTTFHIQIPIAL
jgi:signal transduction histidine kinase